MTIAQCLQKSTELLGISDTSRLDVELLLAAALKKDRTYLYTWPEKLLTQDQAALFIGHLARRKKGEPIAHILGHREFWSLSFAVDSSTLIPRPDTELLIEVVLDLFKSDAPELSRRCLDLGTGTGAILLALASEKPQWQLLGVDKSAEAVALAEKNRFAFGFDHAQVKQSDWFAQIQESLFDIIVSNPPYIDSQDPHLQQGDLRFEPHSALVADAQGLADLTQIINQSWNYLVDQGCLVLEHGYDQAKTVRELLATRGYSEISTNRDYGGNERITYARKTMQEK